MVKMTTKQYLKQIDRLNRKIECKLAEIYQLRTLASSISIATDGERVMSSGNQDRLGTAVVKILAEEDVLNNLIDRYVDKKAKIISQIEQIDDNAEYQVLALYYVTRMSLEEIGDKIGYSKRQTIRIHDNAIKSFEEKFGELYM